MTVRRWAAGATCAATLGLTGCAEAGGAPDTTPTNDVAPTADALWGDPIPGPGPDVVAFQYPALEEYELDAYNFMRPFDPPNPEVDFTETVVWMAEGEGAQLADDFGTKPLDQPLELVSDWPETPPSDLETSDDLVEALRIGYEESLTVAVSTGQDLLFIVAEGGDTLP